MNEKINIDLKSLKFIFNKNKPYLFPIAIILVSIALFFLFVIPQYQVLLTARRQAKETLSKLATIKENLDILTNIKENTLNSQLKTLNLALPLNKDLIGILNSVYSTAQKTGVNLGNFSFKIGDLSKADNASSYSMVKISVPINSDVLSINKFVETISRTVPLSNVDLIKVGKKSSTIDLSFYYMPLGVSSYSQDVRINPISQKGLTIINQLSKFENVPNSETPTSDSSLSAPTIIPTVVPTVTVIPTVNPTSAPTIIPTVTIMPVATSSAN